MKRVVFLCVHNAGRSQMAQALFNKLAGGSMQALSAGTDPAPALNPAVVQAMDEIGVDIRDQQPKLLTLPLLEGADRVITMGCSVEDACPAGFLPAEDWGLEDPAGKTLEEVRRIRDEIAARVKLLLEQLER